MSGHSSTTSVPKNLLEPVVEVKKLSKIHLHLVAGKSTYPTHSEL